MDQMDELLKEAFDQIVKEEYDRRPQKRKEHRFSLRFRWNMHRMMRDMERKPREGDGSEGDSLMELYRPVASGKRRAVLVVLLIMLIGGTVVAAEPVIRWLYNHYIEQHADYVKVQNQEESENPSKNGFQRYEITDIPEGYRLESEEFNENFWDYQVHYINEEENVLFLEQTCQENGNLGKITSDAGSLNEVEAGDFTGYYMTDGSVGSLILSDGTYMVVLSGQFSEEELIEIADSLELADSP